MLIGNLEMVLLACIAGLKKIRVSGYPFGFRVSTGFGFGHEFAPELEFGSGLGFKFGFRFWVPRHSTRTEPDPLASLLAFTADDLLCATAETMGRAPTARCTKATLEDGSLVTVKRLR